MSHTQPGSYDVLVFGAHPDDAEMAMGGTLIRLVDSGKKVRIISLTSSDRSTFGDIVTRKQEAEAAAKVIGCSTELHSLPDTRLENDVVTRELAAGLIRKYKPAIVFTPYHTNPYGEPSGIANRDHYTCGEIVRDAVKLSRLEKVLPEMPKHTVQRLYFYMLPRREYPSIVVDVSSVIDKTMQAIRCYQTQMSIAVKDLSIEHSLMTSRAATGLLIGARYAEGFITDVPLRMTPEAMVSL